MQTYCLKISAAYVCPFRRSVGAWKGERPDNGALRQRWQRDQMAEGQTMWKGTQSILVSQSRGDLQKGNSRGGRKMREMKPINVKNYSLDDEKLNKSILMLDAAFGNNL